MVKQSVLFLIGIVVCWSSSNGADDDVNFVLTAVRNERTRLVSGKCTYSGRKSVIDRTSGVEFDSDVYGEIVFDGDRYRINAVDPGWVIDPFSYTGTTTEHASGQFIRGVCQKSFATNNEVAGFWLSFQPIAEVSDAQSAFVPDMVKAVCFDPRCPTVFSVSNWDSGLRWSDAFSYLEASPTGPVKWKLDRAGRFWTLAISAKDEFDFVTEWSLVVDVENGFVPTKYAAITTPRAGMGDPYPEFEVSVDWEEVAGVQVPIRVSRKGFANRSVREDDFFVAELIWSNVNEPFDDINFSADTFPMEPTTVVQNVVTKERLTDIATVPLAPVKPPSTRVPVFVWVNVLLVAGLIFAYSKKVRDWLCVRPLMSVSAGLLAAVLIFFAQWPKGDGDEKLESISVSTWSPLRPEPQTGPNLDLGEVAIGQNAHRSVLILNNLEVPLRIERCTSDLEGVALLLPSMKIEPGERVGGFLDCSFGSELPLGPRTITVRAVAPDDVEVFVLDVAVSLVAL